MALERRQPPAPSRLGGEAAHFAVGAEWHYFGTGDRSGGTSAASARRDLVAPTGFEPVFQP